MLKLTTIACVMMIANSTLHNKYNGNITRDIKKVSPAHALWIKKQCGVKKQSFKHPVLKIKGGQITKDYQFPWAVGITIYLRIYRRAASGRYFFIKKHLTACSGSLISNKHVLTAQHCFTNVLEVKIMGTNAKEYVEFEHNETDYKADITLGKGNTRVNLRFKTQEKARYIANSNYYNQNKDDWALLELHSQVPQRLLNSKAIVPICLSGVRDVVQIDDNFDVYGQGLYMKSDVANTVMRYAYTTFLRIETFGRDKDTIIIKSEKNKINKYSFSFLGPRKMKLRLGRL